MIKNQEFSTVRVFVNANNNFGNPVGIIIDEQRKLDLPQRQEIAKQLNYIEMLCSEDDAANIKQAILAVHPYEEPEIDFIKLIDVG